MQQIGRHEVQQLVQAGAQLVDVLPRGEHDEEHLPGAVNLPLTELTQERADKCLDSSRPVIVYCWDGL